MKLARTLLVIACVSGASAYGAAPVRDQAVVRPRPAPQGAASLSPPADPKRAEMRMKLEAALARLASDLRGSSG